MSRLKLRVVHQEEFPGWLADTMAAEKLTVRDVATALEVTPKSVYEWLRGNGPLHPNHVKAELLQGLNALRGKERNSRQRVFKGTETAVHALFELLLPEAVVDRLTALPPAYRERYQDRVKEITLWVQRQLDEFLKILEAEYKAPQKTKDKKIRKS